MSDAISIYAPTSFDPADSYGLIGCQLIRHIDRLGAQVNAYERVKGDASRQPDDVRAVIDRPRRATLGGVVLAYPTAYKQYGPLSMAGPRVAVTMFESTILPSGWVDILNDCAAVVVPSRFCEQVFQDNGVRVPIRVIPLGINEEYRPALRSTEGPFTFIAFADRGRRKGWHEATQAFLHAFGDDPAYRLILKMRSRGELVVNITNPTIDMVQQDMSEAELAALYGQAHCMVFAAKGEGFGLPPREFAATGGISIATDWGGLSDDIEHWGWPLTDFDLGPAWRGHPDFEKAGLGEWAEPSIEALSALMCEVAANRENALNIALSRAAQVKDRYRWQRFAVGVYNTWLEVSNGN